MWCGVVWWCGEVLCGVVRHGVWHGVVRGDMWCGVMWCGEVWWCGEVLCGVVWHGVV